MTKKEKEMKLTKARVMNYLSFEDKWGFESGAFTSSVSSNPASGIVAEFAQPIA